MVAKNTTMFYNANFIKSNWFTLTTYLNNRTDRRNITHILRQFQNLIFSYVVKVLVKSSAIYPYPI